MNGFLSDSSGVSSGSQVIPRKRRRVDASNTSTLDNSVNEPASDTEWETRNMKRQLDILCSKLSQAEATINIKIQKEKLLEQERKILEKRVEFDSEMTKQLINDLEIIQSQFSQVKISMEEELKELKSENFLLKAQPVYSTCGRPPTSSQKDIHETQKKMEVAEQRIIDVEEQFDRQKIELDQARVTIKELNDKLKHSMKTRVRQLEELQAAKDTISTLGADEERRAGLEEQILCLQKRLDQQATAPGQMEDDSRSGGDDLQRNKDEDGEMSDVTQVTIKVDPELLLHQGNSSNAIINEGGHNSNSSPGTDDGEVLSSKASDEDESPEEKMETKAKRDKTIIRARCSLRPTNPKFVKIDWDEECERINTKKWACTKCPQVVSTKRILQDHIWVEHYGQHFHCSHCSSRFKSRSYLSAHNKKMHPEILEGGVLEKID